MLKYCEKAHRMGQFPDAIYKCLSLAPPYSIESIKLARKVAPLREGTENFR